MIRSTGDAMIEGPHAIHPPEAIDDRGWLECDLRLSIGSSSSKPPESIAVYTDDTMNREEGFLPPMIRHAIWPTKSADLKAGSHGELLWPGVIISLGMLGANASRVDTIIRTLHDCIPRLPFVPTGLSARRDTPDIDANWELGTLSLYTRNGTQAVEFHTEVLRSDNGFGRTFLDSFDELRKLVEPIPLDGWREYYWNELMSSAQKGWYWDYGRPISG
jgi:hypothetical protein